MATKPNPEFGKRRPAVPRQPTPPGPPVKRSKHVALLVMGTLAVGGGAYAMMTRQDCRPPPSPGMAAPAVPQPGADCSSSGYHGSGGGWSHSSFYSSGSSSSGSSSSSSGSSSVSRGGFGSFAHAMGFGGS